MFASLQLQYAAHWHKKANKHNLLSLSFPTITSFHSVWPISMFQISSFSSVVNVFCKCAIDALFAHRILAVYRGVWWVANLTRKVRIDLIFWRVLFLIMSILYFVYFQAVFFHYRVHLFIIDRYCNISVFKTSIHTYTSRFQNTC